MQSNSVTVVSESESATMAQTIDIHREAGSLRSGSASLRLSEVVK